jgi:DNA modification methylase
MEIKIFNPNNLPVIDYRAVKPLQGELKDLTEANYNKLKNVLIKRGFKVPLFIWRVPMAESAIMEDIYQAGPVYDYWLMDGHQRQRVMIKENMQPYEVPYILIEADTEAEAKAQLLEISSQYGTITQEGFDQFTADLPEVELKDLYFDKLSFSHENEDTEEDEAPEPDETVQPMSSPGEIYQLGRHRLMCGDSTDFGQVSDLMDGQLGDMVFTDPPYGVNYEGKTRESLTIQNDKDSKVWAEVLPNLIAVTKPGAAYYVCCPAGNHFKDFLIPFEQYCYNSTTIIWVKDSLVMGHGDYHYQHEPILYGWNKEGSHMFYGDRSQTTVWNIDRPTASREHPTMKPIALIAKAIHNSSKEGDVILDLFSGSGSGLIACEQLNRTFYGMEIDPKYCDVIRKRYWMFLHNTFDGWEEGTKAINPEEIQDGERSEPDTVPAG